MKTKLLCVFLTLLVTIISAKSKVIDNSHSSVIYITSNSNYNHSSLNIYSLDAIQDNLAEEVSNTALTSTPYYSKEINPYYSINDYFFGTFFPTLQPSALIEKSEFLSKTFQIANKECLRTTNYVQKSK